MRSITTHEEKQNYQSSSKSRISWAPTSVPITIF